MKNCTGCSWWWSQSSTDYLFNWVKHVFKITNLWASEQWLYQKIEQEVSVIHQNNDVKIIASG